MHFDDEKGGGTRGEGKIVRQTALRYQMLVGNSSRLAALRTISKVNRSGITTFSLMLKDFQWFSLFFTDCILRWMNFNNCLCFLKTLCMFAMICNDFMNFQGFPFFAKVYNVRRIFTCFQSFSFVPSFSKVLSIISICLSMIVNVSKDVQWFALSILQFYIFVSMNCKDFLLFSLSFNCLKDF